MNLLNMPLGLLFNFCGLEKGSGTFCRNGPKGASRKRFLTPFSTPADADRKSRGPRNLRFLRVKFLIRSCEFFVSLVAFCSKMGSMKLLNMPLGLLFNFHEVKLVEGISRLVLPGANKP